MLYLLDANVLIDADRDYYPIDRVPQFWDWLTEMGQSGRIKVPQEIYEEVVLPRPSRADRLVDWLRDHHHEMVLEELVIEEFVARVTEQGYADDLTDQEIETVGRDPFLIAYALVDPQHRRLVTTERSRPTRVRANRHLPDVSRDFNIRCIDTFELIQELDFSTNR